MQSSFLKSAIASIWCLYLTFFRTQVSAQKFHFSVIGGATSSTVSVKNYARSSTYVIPVNGNSGLVSFYLESKNKSLRSFFGGMKFEFDLTNSITISSKLYLENTGYVARIDERVTLNVSPDIQGDSIRGEDRVKLLYLSAPLHIIFYAPLPKSRVYVGVGGFASYGLSGNLHFKDKNSTNNAFNTQDSIIQITFNGSPRVKSATYHANRMDYGVSVIAGMEFRNNFFFEIGYDNGFATILKDRFIVAGGSIIAFNFPNKKREFKLGIGYRIK